MIVAVVAATQLLRCCLFAALSQLAVSESASQRRDGE